MESIEALATPGRLISRPLGSGTRRQVAGSLLEADPEQCLPLPEAVNSPTYRLDHELLQTNLTHAVDQYEPTSDHLTEGWYFQDNSPVKS